jgi:hypothetical protein
MIATRISHRTTGLIIDGKQVLKALEEGIVIRGSGLRIHMDDVIGVETEQGRIDVGWYRRRVARAGRQGA